MKYTFYIIILFAVLTALSSCSKNETQNGQSVVTEPTLYDCVFEQVDSAMDGAIDDTERMIMDDCTANSLTSVYDIKNNLVGTWELIGHGEGWIHSVSQPCSRMTITADELTLEFTNAYTDTTTTHSWDIEESIWSGGTNFQLTLDPPEAVFFYIDQFCEQFMYRDGTPFDGNMYLFEKVD